MPCASVVAKICRLVVPRCVLPSSFHVYGYSDTIETDWPKIGLRAVPEVRAMAIGRPSETVSVAEFFRPDSASIASSHWDSETS